MVMHWKPHRATKAFITALLMNGACCGATQAQVKYFDRVPTPAEIQEALMDRPAPDQDTPQRAGSQFKTRGIEWNAPDPGGATETPATPAARPALAFAVKFESGAAKVSKASYAYIDAVATALIRNPELRLTVEGHTDSVGNPRNNVMLSWERAFSVFRLMVEKHGIDPARLQPAGKGSTEPLVNTDLSSSMNRRVQFRLAG